MRTLFGRTFFGIAASLVLLSGIMGIVFYLGLQRSVTVWNVNRTQHLRATFAQQILRVNRQEGRLYEDQLAVAFERFLTPGVSIVVLTPERDAVLVVENGSRLDPSDVEQINPILMELGSSRAPALAVFDQDLLIAYLSVDTLGFRSDLSNRMFINSIILSIGIAVLLSLTLALTGAYLISRRLTGQARSLAVGLTNLAQGSRSVAFASSGAEELQTIADAARTLQQQLLEGEKLRRQWMQDIAHDLRTPITALSSQLEGMIEGVLDPNNERLRSVYQELMRVESLVRNLRELSRVESPELPVGNETLRVDHVIETAVDRLRHRTDAAEMTWDLSLEPTETTGDSTLLLRAITNAVDNAIVHGERHQTITVRSRNTDRSINIQIINQGWIPESDRPHLFDRLYRGDRGRSTAGSGLGLAITQAIITRHKGEITIRQVDRQVVVTIVLARGNATG